MINLTSTSINVSAFSTSTSAGATETLTVGTSSGAYAIISPTNAFVANPVLAGGTSSTANTAAVTATSGGGTLTTNNYTINIAAQTPQTLLYDANGNMTSDGTNTYSWDACDRLVQITYPGSGNNSQFSYDGAGRCVQITENVAGTPTTLEFVWCGNQRCETRNGIGFGMVVNQFFGMGEVIGGTSYFYTKDHLGSIREMTKTVTGTTTTVAQYGYDPYGVKSNIITEVVPSDFQYAGYYLHSRSGLNLTRTRAYNAALGRFISRDPIAEKGGVNLYDYVRNNPIAMIDPSGLFGGMMQPSYGAYSGGVQASDLSGGIQGTFLGGQLSQNGQGSGWGGNPQPSPIGGSCKKNDDGGDGGDSGSPGGFIPTVGDGPTFTFIGGLNQITAACQQCYDTWERQVYNCAIEYRNNIQSGMDPKDAAKILRACKAAARKQFLACYKNYCE